MRHNRFANAVRSGRYAFYVWIVPFLCCTTTVFRPFAECSAQERNSLMNGRRAAIVRDALQWLAARQQEDGAFGAAGPYARDVGVTALCGLAFLGSGSVPDAGPYAENVSKCLDYILSTSQANGYLVNTVRETHGPMYGHGFATMFLAEVYGMTSREDLRDKLKRAVNLIIASQNSEGGWRYYPVPDEADISVTVCQVMALRAARNAGLAVPKEVVDRAVNYIKKCQNPDGGFRYRLFDPAESKVARSAAAIVALYSAGVTRDPAIQRGIDYLEARRALKDDRDYIFYFYYYGVQAYWQAGGESWTRAFPEIQATLIESLQRDHWEDPAIGNEYATAMALIALQIPDNLVPIFER